MGVKWKDPSDLKQLTTIRIRPALKNKAKRLGVNISRLVESAIEAMPEEDSDLESK